MVVFMTAEAETSQSIACATITAYSFCVSIVQILAATRALLELARITIEPNITGAPLVIVFLIPRRKHTPSVRFASANNTVVTRACFWKILEIQCTQK